MQNGYSVVLPRRETPGRPLPGDRFRHSGYDRRTCGHIHATPGKAEACEQAKQPWHEEHHICRVQRMGGRYGREVEVVEG